MERGEPSWQTRSTSPMSSPSSSEAVATSTLQLAALEALFGVEPRLLRQAAVVRRHRLLAEDVAQVPRRAFGHAARVDEHQRGAVQPAPVRRRAHTPASHWSFDITASERRGRQLQRQVALLGVADVDDRAVGYAVDRRAGADQEARHLVDRLLRGRQADAHQRAGCRAQRLQPLQRQRQVAAALARGDGVDLVDDHGAHRRRASGGPTPSPAARTATPACVTRTCGGRAALCWRSRAAACRRCARRCGCRRRAGPACASSARMPAKRRLEVQADVVGRAPSAARRRRPRSQSGRPPGCRPWRTRSSSAARKAVSVLPEPVGAATSVSRPARIAGHPAGWAWGRGRFEDHRAMAG